MPLQRELRLKDARRERGGKSIFRAMSTTVVRSVLSPSDATASAWKRCGMSASVLAQNRVPTRTPSAPRKRTEREDVLLRLRAPRQRDRIRCAARMQRRIVAEGDARLHVKVKEADPIARTARPGLDGRHG